MSTGVQLSVPYTVNSKVKFTVNLFILRDLLPNGARFLVESLFIL